MIGSYNKTTTLGRPSDGNVIRMETSASLVWMNPYFLSLPLVL